MTTWCRKQTHCCRDASAAACHAMQTVKYGPSDSHVGDLYLPAAVSPPVVCLLHGGFWRMPFGRDEFSPVAIDLATRGFAVWNIEYRRLGVPGGGWPGTLQDVAAAIDHLAALAAGGTALDLDQVTVVGHSAGGQLALWSATGGGKRDGYCAPSKVRPVATVGLAAAVEIRARLARMADLPGHSGKDRESVLSSPAVNLASARRWSRCP
jgi:acetyl esterase/lipase